MATITNRTKISEIIRINPDSINAIASLAKPLEKLKNPLLRRILASRVTLAEAAAMGGCDLERLRQVLIPLGFNFLQETASEEKHEIMNKPQWLLAMPSDKMYNLDVRPVMDGGDDPLKVLIKKFGSLNDGEVLCVINAFVPYPLINLLAKESLTFTLEINAGEHHTWFLKRTRDMDTPENKHAERQPVMDDEKSFSKALAVFQEKSVKRIDVRHLPMPTPLQTILNELADLPVGSALYVYHKKIPVYLLEELKNEHFTAHVLSLGEGDVRMLIYDKTKK